MDGAGRAIPLNDPPAWDQLDHFRINRKLEKLAEQYAEEDRAKPTPVERVASLERYLDQIEGVYDKEIDAGRVADTPELWAAIYRHKILPAIPAHIDVLVFGVAGTVKTARSSVVTELCDLASPGQSQRTRSLWPPSRHPVISVT